MKATCPRTAANVVLHSSIYCRENSTAEDELRRYRKRNQCTVTATHLHVDIELGRVRPQQLAVGVVPGGAAAPELGKVGEGEDGVLLPQGVEEGGVLLVGCNVQAGPLRRELGERLQEPVRRSMMRTPPSQA